MLLIFVWYKNAQIQTHVVPHRKDLVICSNDTVPYNSFLQIFCHLSWKLVLFDLFSSHVAILLSLMIYQIEYLEAELIPLFVLSVSENAKYPDPDDSWYQV